MKLEDIGFYTLSDERCKNSSALTRLWRCEMIITDRCNFKCPYCRKLPYEARGDMREEDCFKTLHIWLRNNLKNVRFSGGEPTLKYELLSRLGKMCKNNHVEHIALSTNGSAEFGVYELLLESGFNDFSVSLDACCVSTAKTMSGGAANLDKILKNIESLSKLTYVTVGVVLTEQNQKDVSDIIKLSDSVGVKDIRIIPAAQVSKKLKKVKVNSDLLSKYPILKYRIDNINKGVPVRGLSSKDSKKCGLVLDDMAVAGSNCGVFHYPCIIYLRENGAPIGLMSENVRNERHLWSAVHDCSKDEICKNNCLDVCVAFNNKKNGVE